MSIKDFAMFKRYMIVLAVLTSLTAVYGAFFFFINIVHGDEYLLIASEECSEISYPSVEWTDKCDHANDYSTVNVLLTTIGDNAKIASNFFGYTVYILLLMLVSWVLRWIWSGRNK
jgi:hypothetical protein